MEASRAVPAGPGRSWAQRQGDTERLLGEHRSSGRFGVDRIGLAPVPTQPPVGTGDLPHGLARGLQVPDGIDPIVLSLTACGLTTGEVAAHFAEVYGAKVSKDTISRITDKVLEEMSSWQARRSTASRRFIQRDGVSGRPSRGSLW